MWGGARANAGRKPKRSISSEPHKRRPHLLRDAAVHVRARVVTGVGSLRGYDAYRALERGLVVALRRADFRIVQIGLRGRYVELIVEADDRVALAKGMQGFQIAAAKALNRFTGHEGTVFADRYRPRSLATRPAIRSAITSLARALVPTTAPAIDAAIGVLHARYGRPAGTPRAGPNWRPAQQHWYVRRVHAIPQGYVLAAELATWVARKVSARRRGRRRRPASRA